jgi:phasin family protein
MPAPEATPILKASFPKLVDMSKAMKDFHVPNLDVNALIEAQRKNMQAIAVVNHAAFENLQSYIQRQAALMIEGFQVNVNLMNAIMVAPTAQEKAMHQAEASKTAIDQCFSNVRDAAETLAKCNQQVMEIVSNRMTEGLNELGSLIKTDLAA